MNITSLFSPTLFPERDSVVVSSTLGAFSKSQSAEITERLLDSKHFQSVLFGLLCGDRSTYDFLVNLSVEAQDIHRAIEGGIEDEGPDDDGRAA